MQTQWRAVFALWFAGLCAAGQFSKIGVIFQELGAIWPVSGTRLALIVTVVGMVGIVFGTLAGLVVARLGPRRLIIGALLAGALVSAVQSLGLPFWPMLASRLVEGLMHLLIVVAGPVLIAGVTLPKDQPAAMTLWSTFFGLAFSVTALFGLPLVHRAGPQALWAVHAMLMVLAALLLHRLLPPESAPPAVPARAGGILAEHLEIYRNPRIAAPALGFVFYTLIYVSVLTLVPALVAPAFRTWAAAAMPLLSIAASLGIGVRLIGRIGAVRTVQIGFGIGALGAGLWLVSGGVMQLVAAFVLTGGLGFVQGASFSAIPELNPNAADRARAAGAIAQLGNVGTTAGTPVLVTLVAAFGPAALGLYALPLCLGGIAMHAWLRARRSRTW